jgi:hypothetical protein
MNKNLFSTEGIVLANWGLGVAVLMGVTSEALAKTGLAVALTTTRALRYVLVNLGELGLDWYLLWVSIEERGGSDSGPRVSDVGVGVLREHKWGGEVEGGYWAEHMGVHQVVLRLWANNVVRGVCHLNFEPLFSGSVDLVLLAEDEELCSLVLFASSVLQAGDWLNVEMYITGHLDEVGSVLCRDDVTWEGNTVVTEHIVLATLELIVITVHESVGGWVEVLVDVRVLCNLTLLDDTVVTVNVSLVVVILSVGWLWGQVINEQVLDVTWVSAVVVELVTDTSQITKNILDHGDIVVDLISVILGLVDCKGLAKWSGCTSNVSRGYKATLVCHLVVECTRDGVLDLVIWEMSHDLSTGGVVCALVCSVVECIKNVLLTVYIVDGQVELTLHALATNDLNESLLEMRSVPIVLNYTISGVQVVGWDEKWVNTVSAQLHGAVRSHESRITLATHGQGLVPKLVGDVSDTGKISNTSMVGCVSVHCVCTLGKITILAVLSKLLDGLAGTMARAVIWARSTLASRSLVTREALAQTIVTVAHTLVGALHVEVTLLGSSIRVLFSGTEWVNGGANKERVLRSGKSTGGTIKITLW